MAHKFYSFKYILDVPPYDQLPAVLEAFFTSYPKGDFSLESKEKYKLEFRRGNWTRTLASFGMLAPGKLIKGKFAKWPITVRVLVRPSPEAFRVAVHYQIHLPTTMPQLSVEVQASVDQHVRKELEELANYLTECIDGLNKPPAVETQ